MWIIQLFGIVCFIAFLKSDTFLVSNDTDVSADKRFAVAGIIPGALVAGSSLHGTSAHLLKDSTFSVAVSGSIENYSTWPLRGATCTHVRGKIDNPMRNVDPGFREGFSSHKSSGSTAGTYLSCRYKVHNSYIKIMYSAPYNFDHYVNKLAIAVCDSTDNTCKNWNTDDLYYGNNRKISRKPSYDYIEPVKKCNSEVCVVGVMGSSHQPDIDLRVYPVQYANLSPDVESKKIKERFNSEEYNDLLSEMTGIPPVAPVEE